MRKSILAMALAATVACGSFLGFLPGKDVMTVQAAETVSGGDAVTQLQAPTGPQWASLLVGESVTLTESVWSGGTCEISPCFTDTNLSADCRYEFELYRDDELVETQSFGKSSLWTVRGGENQYGPADRIIVSCYRWDTKKEEVTNWSVFGYAHSEEGIWKFRVRAVSKDGQSYSEWSDFSPELDNRKESFMRVVMGVTGDNDNTSGSEGGSSGDSSSGSGSSAETEDEDNGTENQTVSTSTGEKLTSAAEIYARASIPAVIRTPQSAVTAAAAGAVGGLAEGQKVVASVEDSSCGELARQAVTNAASSVNGKVAAYLEIAINICNRDGGVVQNVEQLSSPIEFTLAAPEGIDGNQYDFAVVRLHGDGKVDILPDLDGDPATITFRTDRFSTYAVIYGSKGAFRATGKDNVPKTGDSRVPALPFAAAGTACAAAAILLKRKTQA